MSPPRSGFGKFAQQQGRNREQTGRVEPKGHRDRSRGWDAHRVFRTHTSYRVLEDFSSVGSSVAGVVGAGAAEADVVEDAAEEEPQ